MENFENKCAYPENFEGRDTWERLASYLREPYPMNNAQHFFAPESILLVDEAQGSYTDDSFGTT